MLDWLDQLNHLIRLPITGYEKNILELLSLPDSVKSCRIAHLQYRTQMKEKTWGLESYI